jgi:hypothetical protein
MGDAVRRNDGSAGDRYYRRIGLMARQHFDTNPSELAALTPRRFPPPWSERIAD